MIRFTLLLYLTKLGKSLLASSRLVYYWKHIRWIILITLLSRWITTKQGFLKMFIYFLDLNARSGVEPHNLASGPENKNIQHLPSHLKRDSLVADPSLYNVAHIWNYNAKCTWFYIDIEISRQIASFERLAETGLQPKSGHRVVIPIHSTRQMSPRGCFYKSGPNSIL